MVDDVKAYTIFCDDIRQETSGKFLLIGVYSGDLIPSQLPLSITLSIMIWVSGLETGEYPVKIEILVDGHSTHELEAVLGVLDATVNATLVLAGFPVQLEKSCLIEAVVSIDGAIVPAGNLRVREQPHFPPPEPAEGAD